MSNLEYWLKLWHINGIGPKSFNFLVSKYPNIADLFISSTSDLIANDIPPRLAHALHSQNSTRYQRDLDWLNATPLNHIILSCHADYPELLKQIYAPPPILYASGNIELLDHFACLAIVGGRKSSSLGQSLAFDFSSKLAAMDVLIVSGLAKGIDKQAHQGALSNDRGKTIAVLANGLDSIYPPQHRLLTHEITSRGLLLSEFPPGVSPLPQHFPRRNRIISGLCHGTVVIEAAAKSGSLITARYALEQGREVFAVPGPINNPLNQGCHDLIQQGAKLTTCIEDIFSEVPALAQTDIHTSSCTKFQQPLANEAKDLLDHLEYTPMTMELIIEKSGLTPEQVSSMLTELEIGGRVTSDAFGHYIRA
ncbi:MAG: DNA-processing protein DprA [Gammaproteobacteria bacterium]